MAKRKQTTVFIRHVGDKVSVKDAEGTEIALLSEPDLMDRARKENWRFVPLALVQAVNEFVNGGWKLTRPPHCSEGL